jgi:probable phosphoglycerate mutase
MTEILLIRHGETDWNVEKRLQGHLDIALNAEGRRQAEALGRALLREPLNAIICSDLQRATETAQAIAAPRGMTVHIEPALRERCYGALEGLRYVDINERYPEAYAAWCERDLDARYPAGHNNAETLTEFSQRAIAAVNQLARTFKHKRIVIVTHGGVLECIYRHAKDVTLSTARDFSIFNASINRMTCNGSDMQICNWGDVEHLNQGVLDEIDK